MQKGEVAAATAEDPNEGSKAHKKNSYRSRARQPHGDLEEREKIAEGVKGKVKWFSVRYGYGFICRDDTEEDVFVHHSAIATPNPAHWQRSLEDGECVVFDVVEGERGTEVVNVKGPDGGVVKGSSYAWEKREKREKRENSPSFARRIGLQRFVGRGRGGRFKSLSESHNDQRTDHLEHSAPTRGRASIRGAYGGAGRGQHRLSRGAIATDGYTRPTYRGGRRTVFYRGRGLGGKGEDAPRYQPNREREGDRGEPTTEREAVGQQPTKTKSKKVRKSTADNEKGNKSAFQSERKTNDADKGPATGDKGADSNNNSQSVMPKAGAPRKRQSLQSLQPRSKDNKEVSTHGKKNEENVNSADIADKDSVLARAKPHAHPSPIACDIERTIGMITTMVVTDERQQ